MTTLRLEISMHETCQKKVESKFERITLKLPQLHSQLQAREPITCGIQDGGSCGAQTIQGEISQSILTHFVEVTSKTIETATSYMPHLWGPEDIMSPIAPYLSFRKVFTTTCIREKPWNNQKETKTHKNGIVYIQTYHGSRNSQDPTTLNQPT